MQTNAIKQFIEQFKNCPKCGCYLLIEAKQKEEIDNPHKFTISVLHDKLTIDIRSNYFVNKDQNMFEFSISIIDGNILFCDFANRFVSLYDLDIILYKDCKRCPSSTPPETFYQSINLFYDRSESKFIAEPWIEFFSFIHEENNYYFSNDFSEKRSYLSIQNMQFPFRNPIIETPFIQFDKFDFRNKDSLFSKINSIKLLI